MPEKNQSVKFTLDYDGSSSILELGEAVEDVKSVYETGYTAYPGTVDDKEAIQIFSFKNEKWYIHFVAEDVVYEIIDVTWKKEIRTSIN